MLFVKQPFLDSRLPASKRKLKSWRHASAGVKAKTQRGRAAPMVGLLVVRGSAVLMRIILSTGSASAAYCYLAMEVTFLLSYPLSPLLSP